MRVWAGETTHVFSLCLFNRWSLGMQPLGPSLEIVTIWGYDLGIIPPLSHVQSSVSAGDVATVSQGATAWVISIARTRLSMVHVHCVTRVSTICYILHRSGWPVVIGVSPAIAPRAAPVAWQPFTVIFGCARELGAGESRPSNHSRFLGTARPEACKRHITSFQKSPRLRRSKAHGT